MAKLSSINKNERRKRLVKQYAGKYSKLKAQANDESLDEGDHVLSLSSLQEGELLDVVDEADLGSGSIQSDGADEQGHTALLLGEDVLDGDADPRLGAGGAGDVEVDP